MGIAYRGNMKRQVFIGFVVLAAALFPAWAVNRASQQSRNIWVVSVLFLAVLGAITGCVAIASPSRQAWNPGPYERRFGPYFRAIAGISFLMAELFAIAVTYAEPGTGIVGNSGLWLANVGESAFPVVVKYATAMEPQLPPVSLFKVQTIVTAFLCAGLVAIVAWAAYFFGMPKKERVYSFEYSGRKRPSFLVAGFCALFAAMTFCIGLFGFLEFNRSTSTHCFIDARCYAFGDDLVVFTAALMKTFYVFVFPLGAVAMIHSAMTLSEE